MAVAEAPALEQGAVTKQDKRLRAFLWFIAVLSAAFIVDYLRGGLFGDEHFRFVANSVSKDALFVALAVIGAVNVRRYASLAVPLLILGHGVLIVANGLMLLFTDQDPVETFGTEISATTFMLVWMAADAVIVAALFLLHRAAQRERYGLKYLSPLEFSTLRALADVLVHGDPEQVPPEKVALNVDDYLSRLDAPGKRQIKLSYVGLSVFPLLYGRPPFALMAPKSRYEFVEKRFIKAVGKKRLWHVLRPVVAAMIRSAQQFVFLGYYGDKDSYASVRYDLFSKRGVQVTPRKSPTITPIRPPTGGTHEADVVVIGSGAAGAILAHGLAKSDRDVLVLERGPYMPREKITENEVDMYLGLYNEGALQMSTDFRVTVLQGMCVGGTTVVNNAICFRAPDDVLARWNSEHRAGLDLDALSDSYGMVEHRLRVQPAPENRATPGWKKLKEGIDILGLPGRFDKLDVNIDDCVGCGYCNIGCKHGRKLSMLENYLPDAEKEGARILADCRVMGIESSNGHVDAVHCEVDGSGPLRIKAKTVVVAAGAVSSSYLLLNSGIKRGLAGRNLQFNIVSPLAGVFDEEIRAFAGLQMSHYYEPPGSPYMLETWFNPPATQSLVMPGWFREHFDNMRAYSDMACAGVVVGTTGPASVRVAGKAPKIKYKPARPDLERMVAGLKQLGEIYLAAGAERVMPATYLQHDIRSAAELAQLDQYAGDNEGLTLNSSHPQGGNPISADWQSGVVDPNFKVHGKDNLFVCDASVFPGSVGVNPQLTVMALADYAVPRIAAQSA